jgi:ribosome maturation factor RimP
MDLREEIKKLAEAALTNTSQFVVDVVVSSRKGPKKVLVVLDGDNGVTIDDCANISREVSKSLDEMALPDESLTLEVSTPGLDQPLLLKRQYKKNIGRGLKVKLHDKIEEGKLTEATEEKIVLLQETGSGKKKEERTLEIQFSEIEKAFVLVSFK